MYIYIYIYIYIYTCASLKRPIVRAAMLGLFTPYTPEWATSVRGLKPKHLAHEALSC